MLDVERMYSEEAEDAVIGSLIFDGNCMTQVLCILPEVEAFFQEPHKIIYELMLHMYMNREPIDMVALHAKLKSRKQLDKIGGIIELDRMYNTVCGAANAEYYANVVKEKYNLRKLITLSETINNIVHEGDDVDDMLNDIRSKVLDLNIETKQAYTKLDIDAGKERLLHANNSLMPTKFCAVDNKIVGFGRGDLVIVAGRPSMGKSIFADQVSQNITWDSGTALIFSLEMSEEVVAMRKISARARVNPRNIENESVDDIKETCDELKNQNIYYSSQGETLEEIAAIVHMVKKRHGLDVVVLDYLQMMKSPARSTSRNQDLDMIINGLKRIAMKEDIVMIVVSQLNRACEQRTDRRPRMSDLRDSGGIEQAADYIMLLYRDDYYRDADEEKDGLAEVNIAKNRNGETGTVRLVFLAQYMTFGDLYYGK